MAKLLSLDQVIAANIKRRSLQFCAPYLYWLESRPQESGRGVIVRFDPKKSRCIDLTPAAYSVRSNVHEYGGGDFLATSDGVFFVNASDQQIYCQNESLLTPITTRDQSIETRYADFSYNAHSKTLFSVRERHGAEVINDIVAIELNGRIKAVAEGKDFYAAPRVSPDGSKLCWLQWSLPHMLWDNCQLVEASLNASNQPFDQKVLVSDPQIAVIAPTYDSANQLWFIDDRDGYWRVRKSDNFDVAYSLAQNDCGMAAWSLALQPFCVDENNNAVAALLFTNGMQAFSLNGRVLPTSFAECGPQLTFDGHDFYFFASGQDSSDQLYAVDQTGQIKNIISSEIYLAAVKAEVINVDGIYANYYQANTSEKSALIVFCHSGPTGWASTALNLTYQYFLQNGFSILDVNYRGSYGYGRAYRQALLGQWGVLDVEDSFNALQHVLAHKPIDQYRVYLRGNSAGGLTALHLLARAPQLFRAAALRYPVVDLAQLQACSHKFESGYLAQLIGSQQPDDANWTTRSPSSVLNQIITPLLLMQGDQDPVVPMAQSERLIANLRARSVAHQLLTLQGEGHGFRRADSQMSCLKAELDWFSRRI